MSFSKKQIAFIDAAVKYNETMVAIDLGSVSKIDLQNIANFADMKFPHFITRVQDYKVGRGLWAIPVDGAPAIKAVADSSVGVDKAPDPVVITDKPTEPVKVPVLPTTSVVEMTKGTALALLPAVPEQRSFVRSVWQLHGCRFDFQVTICFIPVYVTGLSGNGKTFMIEQACC